MTNHSLINASGTTHAKIGFVALAVSAVFVALVSATGMKSDLAGARASSPVVVSGTTLKVAASDRTLVR